MLTETVKQLVIPIRRDSDIVLACQKGRILAEQIGFRGDNQVVIVITISELAGNIVRYTRGGEIILKVVQEGQRRGLMIVAQDNGPGIVDIEQALQDGFSTGNGLGLGLPGVRRLMDEFEIVSEVDQGTTVITRKWLR